MFITKKKLAEIKRDCFDTGKLAGFEELLEVFENHQKLYFVHGDLKMKDKTTLEDCAVFLFPRISAVTASGDISIRDNYFETR